MKILLFGGTFDPPHNGHKALLQSCISAVAPEKVLIIPAFDPPHKALSGAAGPHRLAMARLFAEEFQNAQVDEREMLRQGKSYTVDTLRELCEVYPESSLYLCVGSDMLLSFTEWHEYREILRRATLVSHLRCGEDDAAVKKAAANLACQGARIVDSGGEVLPLSSSEIRAACTRGEDVSALVPPAIWAYIQQNELYREGERYRVDYRARVRKLGKTEIE